MLGLCLAGTVQSQDRDTRGLPKTSATALRPEARVDINHASVEELMKVPGMTPSWAGRIVRFRPYRTKLDLVERGVVTSQVYDQIKDYVIAHQKAQ
jgi:DNA uptake protein ComE-like DNA-binding protein